MNNPDTLNPFYNSFVQFAGDVPGKDLHSDTGFVIFYCCINYERYCKVMLWETIVVCSWQQHVPVLSKNEILMGHSQVYKLIKSIYNHGIKKTPQGCEIKA